MNTDLISRQAAIDAIRKDVMGGLNYAGILTRLPSVTPRQEPCEDCISRAEVHDLLATWLSDKLDEKTREVLEVIDGKVEDMSPVTPKQPAEDWSRVRVKEYRQGQINILKIIEANIHSEIKRIREELQGLKESEEQA